ncbi:MAG: ribosome biogenesis GTP-binding protein YihA/YsxC [Rhodothermia bacterium]|nr:MAG: ribosome biogenesis GTP-binding protein YihA/YsxC [Rhodothermia bacterium]
MDFREATFVTGAVSMAGMPRDGLSEVAFVGRSNVGKSSLINMLLGRKSLARTSGTPGKTQEINFYLVNRSLYFVDLPGFGYARASKRSRAEWRKMIGNYVSKRKPLKVVFQLIDSRHPPTDLDREVMLLLKESAAARIVLLTKGDKLSGNQRATSVNRTLKILKSYHTEIPVILTSSKTARGKKETLNWIRTLA